MVKHIRRNKAGGIKIIAVKTLQLHQGAHLRALANRNQYRVAVIGGIERFVRRQVWQNGLIAGSGQHNRAVALHDERLRHRPQGGLCGDKVLRPAGVFHQHFGSAGQVARHHENVAAQALAVLTEIGVGNRRGVINDGFGAV